MKNTLLLTILILSISIFSCKQSQPVNAEPITSTKPTTSKTVVPQKKEDKTNTRKTVKQQRPLKSLEAARQYVKENFKNPKETLWISDTMNDKVGVNMAIIMDRILKVGYMPDGFEQKEGSRIYKFKK